MTQLSKEFYTQFDLYVAAKGFERGLVAVPVENILTDFTAWAKTVPATKGLIGRALTKKFLKKQSSESLTQCYYLNKSV